MLKFHTSTIKIKHSAKCKLSSTQLNIIQKKKRKKETIWVGGEGGLEFLQTFTCTLFTTKKMLSMPPAFSHHKKPIPLSRTAGEKVGAGGTRNKYLLDISIKKAVTKELMRSDFNQIDHVKVLLKLE